MHTNTLRAAFWGLGAFALAGCGAGAEPSGSESASAEPRSASQATKVTETAVTNENELNLVARVDLANETSVAFYEPEPGGLFAIELGKVEVAGVLKNAPDNGDTVALYERISGKSAPDALRQAASRAHALAAQAPTAAELASAKRAHAEDVAQTAAPSVVTKATNPSQLAGGIGQTRQAWVDDGWYWSNYCLNSGPGLASIIWLGYGGDRVQQLNSVANGTASVMAVNGDGVHVTFKHRRFYTWSSGVNVDLALGYSAYYSPRYVLTTATYDIKSEIGNTNGTTDLYDACMYGQD